MIKKTILSFAASIIKFFIIYLFFLNAYADTVNNKYEPDEKGILALMYHRFEENKYPSTNIKIDIFQKHLNIIKENNFSFPYLHDEMQDVAKIYDAVCTPDFFGYNKNLELQYRGRIRELKDLKPVEQGNSGLKIAMELIAKTGRGPIKQIPSMGCNIKWFK